MIDELIKDMMENHKDWKAGQYHLINEKRNIDIWIGGGVHHYKMEIPCYEFSYWEKRKFFRAYKKLVALKIMAGGKK